jgi:2-dehydro-3-deoxyphosphooctonate aldolase (KDO 8-P synthase)
MGCPVIFDVTHSIRVYGRPSHDPSGGQPEHIHSLSRAGVAAGCDGIFIETHPRLEKALCDKSSMLPINELEGLLNQLKDIRELVLEN